MHSENLEAGKEFGKCHGFKVCMGACYLGGYIGDDESKRDWLREQKNRREISPGELLRGGMNNPIRVDIYTTRHLGHRGCIHRSGEDTPGNIFASYYLWKEKTPLTHHRSSKYDTGQEIHIGTPEASDVS